MRAVVLLASLASIASVHETALASPELPVPIPVSATTPSFTDVTSFIPKDILNPVPLPGLPTMPNATAILGPLDQATALAAELSPDGLDVGSFISHALEWLGFATQITGTLVPLTGVTGVIPIAGNLPAGSITGADATKVVQAIKDLFTQYANVLVALESNASIIRSVPGDGGLNIPPF